MITAPRIHLYADVLGGFGGIETYLDALARRLHADKWPVRIAVSLNAPAPFLEDLRHEGIPVYIQRRVPGDRWQLRQRLLVLRLAAQLKRGDWVYCVRQPMPEIYPMLIRLAHLAGARVAASWMFAPEFLPLPRGARGAAFAHAVSRTDAVISVSECTRHQFREVYGYDGPVHVVRYHNREFFEAIVPLPPAPPYHIGFLGRIDVGQKNLDTLLDAFALLLARRDDVRLNLHGSGPDEKRLAALILERNLQHRVVMHGRYDHRCDLRGIIAANHLFIYTSRFEGGPCFSLLELLQAGRFVVASPVGGIPDIYAERPEIGSLVAPDQAGRIAESLQAALLRVCEGQFVPSHARKAYADHFAERHAHRQFLAALGLEALAQ